MRKLDLLNLEPDDQNLVDHIKKALINAARGRFTDPFYINNIVDVDLVDIYINTYGSVFVNYKIVYQKKLDHNADELIYNRFFIKNNKIYNYSLTNFHSEYKPISELVGIQYIVGIKDPNILISSPDPYFEPLKHMSIFEYSKDKTGEIGLVELKYFNDSLSFLINKEGQIVSGLHDSTINRHIPQPVDIFEAEREFVLRVYRDRQTLQVAIKNGQEELYTKLYALKPPTDLDAEEGEA